MSFNYEKSEGMKMIYDTLRAFGLQEDLGKEWDDTCDETGGIDPEINDQVLCLEEDQTSVKAGVVINFNQGERKWKDKYTVKLNDGTVSEYLSENVLKRSA